ncbi:hypothetical protein ACFSTE_15750 [Aquimarina hainanensis]|uniref:Uncharacterized protein n=1 Tax=Aquimarina hainanensis TaxID=1578017 RepID=A0ABW5N9R1_9FLAO
MEIILLAIGAFVIVSKIIKNAGNSIFNDTEKGYSGNIDNTPTTINNYTTHNHLHITKDDLDRLKQ